MNLTWEPLAKAMEKQSISVGENRGVYIWGFRIQQRFIPYYVGIAENIETRIVEHLSSILSGKYSIYDKGDLMDFRNKDAKFEPEWPKNFYEFLSKRKSLAADIKYMIDHFEYSFAEVTREEYPEIRLKEVEKYIISLIGKESLANTRGGQSKVKEIHFNGDLEMVQILEIL